MSPTQAAVAIVALVGISVLGALGKIDTAALTAIYSAVIGGALGHANGFNMGTQNGRAVEHAALTAISRRHET